MLFRSHRINRADARLQAEAVIPAFGEVAERLVEDGDSSLVARLSPLFDLDLFAPTGGSLQTLVSRTTVMTIL